MNDAEFRRRAHAFLSAPRSIGIDKEREEASVAEHLALLAAGPVHVEQGVAIDTIPWVCRTCGIGAMMDMKTMNCAKCGCTLRRATILERDCWRATFYVSPCGKTVVIVSSRGEALDTCRNVRGHGGPCGLAVTSF